MNNIKGLWHYKHKEYNYYVNVVGAIPHTWNGYKTPTIYIWLTDFLWRKNKCWPKWLPEKTPPYGTMPYQTKESLQYKITTPAYIDHDNDFKAAKLIWLIEQGMTKKKLWQNYSEGSKQEYSFEDEEMALMFKLMWC